MLGYCDGEDLWRKWKLFNLETERPGAVTDCLLLFVALSPGDRCELTLSPRGMAFVEVDIRAG